MAQNSKKLHIAETALKLFLEFGFKGTSVDMVVKHSGVSKPTVYNHFPDKAALIGFIVEHWRAQQPDPFDAAQSESWLNANNVGLLRLAIGEGQRFPQAQQQLFGYVERVIRAALREQHGETALIDFNQRLLHKLMS